MKLALSHQETDLTPYNLGFDLKTRERLVELTGDERFDRDLDHHFAYVGIGYPETAERVDRNHYTDAFGVIWEEAILGELGVVRDPILQEPSLRGYEFPPPICRGCSMALAQRVVRGRWRAGAA